MDRLLRATRVRATSSPDHPMPRSLLRDSLLKRLPDQLFRLRNSENATASMAKRGGNRGQISMEIQGAEIDNAEGQQVGWDCRKLACPKRERGKRRESSMLGYAITFLVVALIAGAFGLFGVAGLATEIAKILFFVFIVLFVISLITGRNPRV
jgi:uncharacterized membrane protein YtjA (UPF0391 family)